MPHHLALFYLKPKNPQAEEIVSDQQNSVFATVSDEGKNVLDIGHIRPSGSNNTLATLGRGSDADIYIACPSISRIQCSFEVDPQTCVIMFHDRSRTHTSHVSGPNAMPFEPGRPRKIVVQEGLNKFIQMGGSSSDTIEFELVWYQDPVQTMEKIKSQESNRIGYINNPRLDLTTEYVANAASPTQNCESKMRHVTIGTRLGAGRFGDVYKAVDVDSGKLMAVKVLKKVGYATRNQSGLMPSELGSEAKILSTLKHPHIVDYIKSQGWGGAKVEIFMGLKDGTLKSLVESGRRPNMKKFLHQMLRALHYLDKKNIIHRDVKLENILYIAQPNGGYHFQLGDFGLSKKVDNATTAAGSPRYMAPEIFRGQKQTHKIYVWALFVTILWTADAGGFRLVTRSMADEEVYKFVLCMAEEEDLSLIKEMARESPECRASAGDMLASCFKNSDISM
ncbi:kinase-like domain-containing protein [Phaeosphaeriaceae sp. PMI808]|nr:kinase-like domain-containing protein [Phaeosphaeriaceae sp. PMI808]